MRLWSVEGNRLRLDGGTMFGNAPRVMWEKWLHPDGRNLVQLASRALLVDGLDGKKVLFEAGVGAFFPPKLRERFGVQGEENALLASLEKRGTRHDEIDAVVLNHMHFDHVGGILAAYKEGQPLRLLFPKAHFLVSRAAWDRANWPHARDRASFIPELPGLLRDSGRLEVIGQDLSSSMGKAVKFRLSHGHSPGMLLAEIGGTGGVTFCSDLIPGRAWVHLPITTGLDRAPEQLVDEKMEFLEDKIAKRMRIFFTHDPQVALATPFKDNTGRYGVQREERSVEGIELQ